MTPYSGTPFSLKRLIVDHAFWIRKLVWPTLDIFDYVYRALNGKIHLPPLSARQKVAGSFFASIAEFEVIGSDAVRLLREVTQMESSHSILDIGCGCGRTAFPLLAFLNPSTKYYGGDVDRAMVKWCTKNITTSHPNSAFFHIEAYNSFYNPDFKNSASAYTFPIPEASINRVIMVSVFTHMLPDDIQNYLREIARMLMPDGIALISFFITNPQRLEGPQGSVIRSKFPFDKGAWRVASEKYPELDISFDQEFVNQMIHAAGLEYQQPILWGKWTGEAGFSGHDFVALRRRNQGT